MWFFFSVPLPFMDNDCYPTSIALPFRQKPLYNLDSCKSSYVLLKYYLTINDILRTNPVLLADFKHRFSLWTTTKVYDKVGSMGVASLKLKGGPTF